MMAPPVVRRALASRKRRCLASLATSASPVTTDRGSEREARKVLDDVLKNIPKGYNYADLGRVKVEVSKPSY